MFAILTKTLGIKKTFIYKLYVFIIFFSQDFIFHIFCHLCIFSSQYKYVLIWVYLQITLYFWST